MSGADAFVSEDAPDFIDSLEAAYDKALQMQLGGDSQIKIHMQGVVMRDERTRIGTAGFYLQHRGFDFEEVPVIQKLANRPYSDAALAQGVPDRRVDDHVDITLAIAGFHIGETFPAIRQGQKGLTEDLIVGHPDR